jgi:uncharacterized membrane protein
MNRTVKEWLARELPAWAREGLVTDAGAAELRLRYGVEDAHAPRNLAVIILAILGGLLVGLGTISLLAHNWADLPKAVRLSAAFVPLFAGQGLVLFVILTGRESLAWREAVGVGWMLATGSCIALVSQVYHIPGDAGEFMLTWMLLSLPIPYFLGAVVPAAGCLAGLIAWAGYEQAHAGQAIAFWVWAALLGPFVVRRVRAAPESARTALLLWAVGLAATAGVGLTIERVLPGLWIVLYASLFALLVLAQGGEPVLRGFWKRPLASIGATGTVILALMLSCDWPWDAIGLHHRRFGPEYPGWAAAFDAAFAAALALAAIARWGLRLVRGGALPIAFGFAPILAILSYASAGTFPAARGITLVAWNALVVLLGGSLVVRGLRERGPGMMNAGLLALSALIAMRFFDDDFSFLVRGLVFIGLGAALLVFNAVFARRTKGAPQ